jgi:hypothetical protein
MSSRLLSMRLAAAWRSALVGVCVAAFAVSPVVARQPPDPAGPAAEPYRQFLPLARGSGPLPTAIDLIEAALAAGRIDGVTALEYRVYAVFGDPRLPAEYLGANKEIRSGTEVMSQVLGRYDELPADAQTLLLPFLIPPYYVGSWANRQLAAEASAAPPADAPPDYELSESWAWKGNDKVKVWWWKEWPEAERQADLVLSALNDTIWPELTKLMKRVPITDEGQKGSGGDGRLDIALVDIADRGVATRYAWTSIISPGYIQINVNRPDDGLLATVAHEFMHILQYTYDVRDFQYPQYPHMRWSSDQWLVESTATWAEDYVYPKVNTEQAYLPAFLDYPGLRIIDRHPELHIYGAYIFPFYLTHRYTPDLIRRMWEAMETTKSALEAVNSVIPGGFKQQWPEFARYNWNRVPQKDYREWDAVERGVYAPAMRVPAPLEDLTFGWDDYDVRVPTDIAPLAAAYYHWVFPVEEVRSVVFYNPFRESSDPAVRVQALVKIGGAWEEVKDWTSTVRTESFCRDARAGRVEELVIILTNSNWQDPEHVLKAYQPMRLVATNVGCWRWRGTTKQVHVERASKTIHAEAELVLQLHRPPRSSDANTNIDTFDVLEGTVRAWITASPGAICNWSAGPVTQALEWSDASLSVHTVDMRSTYRRLYEGAGGFGLDPPQNVNCSIVPGVWTTAMFFNTHSGEKWYLGADGQTMAGSAVIWDDDQTYETSEWNFTAEREP